MDRRDRAKLSQHTLNLLEKGHFEPQLSTAIKATRLCSEDDLSELLARIGEVPPTGPTQLRIVKATTIGALLDCSPEKKVGLLNFASAKNPGGGFLKGSEAQEESLARSSGLYPCLMSQPHFYRDNAKDKSGLYCNSMIVSPRVPFFRQDDGSLLEDVRVADVISMPAVNRTVARKADHETMRYRIQCVVAMAIQLEWDVAILGAWGCGVFGNPPQEIAELFRETLDRPEFKDRIPEVVFAIPDQKTHDIFRAEL